ncbi:uncharacterized protein LOC122886145 isoform X4 [Siniperca chuatsi]|uniref:uncharacterized protein LOC122886145 isoform X4 n=1 Tax=Siniperca chuatsi TaxID=119488 RepID=UPI001CE16635|nr:uncharacterized protein LOC122886145 isoform X4 [Siniperca chuatsi]
MRSLRSSGRALLAVSEPRLKTEGDQAFEVQAPRLLNSLLEDLRKLQDQDTKPEPSPGPVSSSIRRRVLGTHPFDHRDVLVSRGDSVMFTCNISNANTTQINWTKEISPSWYFLYMLTPAIGFLLCGFTPAVCLCRKLRTRTPNQNPVQDQFHLQSEGEVVLRQPQGGTDSRTNNQQRSQYMERVNSIYGL